MNTAVRVDVPCPEARHIRQRFTAMSVPQMIDGELVVNGTTVELPGMESLRSLETLQDLQELRSWNHVPGGRLTIKVRQTHADDGTI